MQNSLKQLRDNWVIITCIVAMISTWTMYSSRLANAEEKIVELQVVNNQIQQIQIDVAVIKEQITNINSKLQ